MADKDVIRMEIELHETEGNTILLGYEIGSAQLDHGRKLSITGSGKILRFTVYAENAPTKQYDLDLLKIAAEVVHR